MGGNKTHFTGDTGVIRTLGADSLGDKENGANEYPARNWERGRGKRGVWSGVAGIFPGRSENDTGVSNY